MFVITLKSEKTKYKYVHYTTSMLEGRIITKYRAKLPQKGVNRSWSKLYDNLNEAAKGVDLKLIERGENPVNILKPAK